MEILKAKESTLRIAYDDSWYFIAGTGGDLSEWVVGYETALEAEGIGKPTQWWVTTGRQINLFAGQRKGVIVPADQFQRDLMCLIFPLNELNVGKLAIFRLGTEDRWFSDVIDNMRSM